MSSQDIRFSPNLIFNMMTIELNETNFPSEVLEATVPVMVDFWSPHCGPCKAIAPLLEQLAEEMAGTAKVGKVNVQDHLKLAVPYGVRALPTLLFFKNGEVKEQIIGANVTKEQLRGVLAGLM
jgi:thioredoxin 1